SVTFKINRAGDRSLRQGITIRPGYADLLRRRRVVKNECPQLAPRPARRELDTPGSLNALHARLSGKRHQDSCKTRSGQICSDVNRSALAKTVHRDCSFSGMLARNVCAEYFCSLRLENVGPQLHLRILPCERGRE